MLPDLGGAMPLDWIKCECVGMATNLRAVWVLAGVVGACLLSACATAPSRQAAVADDTALPGTAGLRIATSHPSVLAAGERLAQAREKETIARADVLPEVNLTASETAYAGDLTTSTARTNGHNLGASVSLSLSKALAGVHGARAAGYATQAETEAVRRSVDRTIVELAMEKAGLERALKTEKIRSEHRKQLAAFFNRQERRFGAGEVSATELQVIRARVKFVESELVRIRSEAAFHRARLHALAGAIEVSEVDLVDLAGFVPATERQATAIAVARNPALREAEWRQNAASQNVSRAEKSLLPDISVSFNTVESSTSYTDNSSASGNGTNVRVDLRVPLFDGGRRLAELSIEKSRLREQAYTTQAQRRSTESDISGQWQGVMAAREMLSLAGSRVERNRRALSGTLEGESVGARSVDQVLDAYENLADAQIALIDAQAQVTVRSHELLATLGLLSEAYRTKPRGHS
ncbi:outer membrane protein TolC [Hoeflea marina]|uniref:Outer membrane protein TolC n=1 Tax=Hoeflea marina TaxID=274592 RepID=A0A317PEN3_9HYPH|nr:TolC family protein [Hoeflea marina]PWV98365.1 outer membrane protein TolC [Hoeflea marina]